MQAYKIYIMGDYTSVDENCSQAFLTLGASQIYDSEIGCDLKRVRFSNDSVVVLEGKNCSAEGHKLPDFTFSIKNNEDETIAYKNSGETIWQTLRQCPTERKIEQ